MDYGGTQKLKSEVDFTSDFDTFNEECSVQYMIDAIDQNLDVQLKPKEVYESKLNELTEIGSIDSLEKYNIMNVHRLHINEIDILSKNRDYLMQMRKNI